MISLDSVCADSLISSASRWAVSSVLRRLALAVAMLAEQRFLPHQILAQPVDFPQRVLVVVGRLGQERDDFGAVEAAELRPEALLLEVERRDPHDALGGR